MGTQHGPRTVVACDDTFGEDGFEAAARKVAQVENKIGTYDLSVFTAKT